MAVVVLTHSEVHRLLTMAECIDVVADALRTLARGDAALPLRTKVPLADGSGLLGLMPAVLGTPRVMGVKVLSVMPGNHGTPYESHQGAVMLFECEHGAPIAIVDASSITSIRTAAASGVATRALARPDAKELAILGSGVQAESHLEAMATVRALDRVRVWSRSFDHARAFAARTSGRYGVVVEAVASARDAVAEADIVCTTTGAREPVLRGEWLAPGTHVNAVGACTPATRELDGEAVRRARLYVDRRESCLAESGDFLIARSEGVVDDAHIVGELGEVLLDRIPGRRAPDEVTLFESLGIGIEDLAAGHHVWRKAEASGAGTRIELGGLRAAPAGA